MLRECRSVTGFLTKDDKNTALELLVQRNLEKRFEPPMIVEKDIARILKDPVQRKEFKEQQKQYIRDTVVVRYYEGSL